MKRKHNLTMEETQQNFQRPILEGEEVMRKLKERFGELDYDLEFASKITIENFLLLNILKERFGITSIDDAIPFVVKNSLSIFRDEWGNFIGVTYRNRWLYTTSGQIIGKQGNRWMVENIKGYGTDKKHFYIQTNERFV